MTAWKPIERACFEDPIWVLKYDMWQKDGNFCEAHTPGAEKFTSCHGYYTSEADARKAHQHFPTPNSYRMERVYRRELLPEQQP